MEEKKLSPEQPEEVIELLDIVAQSASDADDGQVEELVLPDEACKAQQPEKTDAEKNEDRPDGGEDVVLPDENTVLVQSGPEASGPNTDAPLETKMPEEPSVKEADTADDGGAGEETVEEAGSSAEKDELLALREKYESEVKSLEERVASLEKNCRELEESVESLSQQLAQAGTMFLEDASVRLNMEELVSRMLDARLPSSSEQDGEEGGLEARVDSLERSVRDWEKKSEQMAASAAARVIRDEIAAMRAEAETHC